MFVLRKYKPKHLGDKSFIKGADYANTVTGDSVWPEYSSGCRAITKRINERAFIDRERVYVLDTVNGTIIKNIMPTDSRASSKRRQREQGHVRSQDGSVPCRRGASPDALVWCVAKSEYAI